MTFINFDTFTVWLLSKKRQNIRADFNMNIVIKIQPYFFDFWRDLVDTPDSDNECEFRLWRNIVVWMLASLARQSDRFSFASLVFSNIFLGAFEHQRLLLTILLAIKDGILCCTRFLALKSLTLLQKRLWNLWNENSGLHGCFDTTATYSIQTPTALDSNTFNIQ